MDENSVPDEAELRKLSPEFFLLPQSIQEKAIFHGKSVEYGWKMEDVEDAIQAAVEANLAILGGQPQFQTSFATCEAYWLNYDSQNRRVGESWAEYVKRSSEEVRSIFKMVQERTDYLEEARAWPILKEKIEMESWDPITALVFLLYFETENEVNG